MKILTLTVLLSLSVFAIDKVIYGTDDRVEAYQFSDRRFAKMSQSVGAMIHKDKFVMVNTPNGKRAKIMAMTLKESEELCEGQRFADQLTPADCSGFLVSPRVLITAGHCVTDKADCNDYLWTFNFHNKKNLFNKNEIYKCKKVITSKLTEFQEVDYAIILLDRPVKNATPLNFRRNGKLYSGERMVVIGHPSGLPLKITDRAVSLPSAFNSRTFFRVNSDTFAGNSGSPVINRKSGVVEGILVRGEQDYRYIPDRGCSIVNICSKKRKCKGEDATRITIVKELYRKLN